MSQFCIPPAIDLIDDNLVRRVVIGGATKSFLLFFANLKEFGATDISKATQTAIILHCGGVHMQEMY